METDIISLTAILGLIFLLPLIAQWIPTRPFPEAVVCLIGGMVCGPYALNWIHTTGAINLLSELGLAFLFLLAGYDMDPQIIKGKQGRRGLWTWMITLGISACAVMTIPVFWHWDLTTVSAIIILTTTALGTLLPILKERGVEDTPIGRATIAYGLWGELGPIFLMALLMTNTHHWKALLLLLAFIIICIGIALLPKIAHAIAIKLNYIVVHHSNSSSYLPLRLTILLLVGLVALSSLFSLDAVLGAFAAGFILRYLLPQGNDRLDGELQTMGSGFFIPIFFVVSGCNINIKAIGEMPIMLIAFIVILIVVRAIPIYISLKKDPDATELTSRQRWAVAFYCTTALPIILAVTTVAQSAGAISAQVGSILVAAGAITVLVMPLIASLLSKESQKTAVLS